MLHFLAICLVACVSGYDADITSREVMSKCDEDSVLKCEATPKPGVQYRAVTWYRVSEDPPNKKTGVLTKRLGNNSFVRTFSGFDRPAELLSDSLDLFLPNVTAQDAGRYLCVLQAPVGEKKVEGHVLLKLPGCSEKALYKNVMFDMTVCVSLVLALVACFLCWVYVRNISILRSKMKGQLEQTLKAHIQKKNLKLIYTPGSNGLGPSSYHHVCV